ncbi:MAG TPA: hypothetical protein VNL18_10530 [Gemmatimonadales bacterium]|nr:hypothetical protein [Gemmatimonadales bacterium]
MERLGAAAIRWVIATAHGRQVQLALAGHDLVVGETILRELPTHPEAVGGGMGILAE